MLSRLRSAGSRAAGWVGSNRLSVALIVLALAGGLAVGAAALGGDDDGTTVIERAPAPQVVVEETPEPEDAQPAEDLGFPAFATKNTTRVAGLDPVGTAAGVALAVYPSTGGLDGPDAVTLVDAGDWQGGIAAASLFADPVGAPILITESGEIPELTDAALRALSPKGAAATVGRQAFVVGEASAPESLDTLELGGANSAEVAVEIAELRERLAGRPAHLLLTTSDAEEIAMPAAAWAARSGDPILYVQREGVPAATRKYLTEHDSLPVFVLGAESAISKDAFEEVRKLVPNAVRVGAEDAVDNAIEFARYTGGTFGWNINDPGHGFVVANASRPLEAAAAAPLSGSGTWGPLLVTESATELPAALRGYLLDLKPGYESDPTRALYNHIWVIGDPEAISVGVQAQLDEIAEVAPVTSGSGTAGGAAPPPATESQPGDEAPGQGSNDDETGEEDERP